MNRRPTIVIGTANTAKVDEVKRFLNDLPVSWRIAGEAELGFSIEESGETYQENAELKARAIAEATDLPTLANDGGMEIPALDNWPGVRTRRLDGTDRKSDDELIKEFATRIETLSEKDRVFRFATVWSFACPGGDVQSAHAELSGELRLDRLKTKRPGMPERTFWFIPSFGKYFLDFSQNEYDRINYNRRALERLKPIIIESLELETVHA